MIKFNKTNLNGVNGYAKARIEFSKKKRVNDKLEDNNEFETSDVMNISESSSRNNSKDDKLDKYIDNKHHERHKRDRNQNDERERERERDRNREADKNKGKRERNREKNKEKEREVRFFKDPEPQKRNVCFICKLPGHFAKECVLTRDSCYECGEKGHIAKECQGGVREAKVLTKNRVKAIFSQQSAFKFITPQIRLNNIISYLKSKELAENINMNVTK